MCLISNYNNIGENDEEQALRDRGYKEDRIKFILKKEKVSSFKSLNVSFHTNKSLKYPYFSYVLGMFDGYNKGILPFDGSFADQPAKIIEIFNVLHQLSMEAEHKMRKKLEKESKQRGKS